MKVILKKNNEGYNYFEIDENEVYRGRKEIHSKIDELNSDENSKIGEFKYYLLKTPIEFLDNMKLSKEEKEKIEFIDFPGLDTNFEKAKDQAKNLLRIILY